MTDEAQHYTALYRQQQVHILALKGIPICVHTCMSTYFLKISRMGRPSLSMGWSGPRAQSSHPLTCPDLWDPTVSMTIFRWGLQQVVVSVGCLNVERIVQLRDQRPSPTMLKNGLAIPEIHRKAKLS